MTGDDRRADEITVLIKVLDLLEMSMRSREIANSDAVQINQIINQFLGSSPGTIIQAQSDARMEVNMGDEYKIGGHAQVGAVGKGAHVGHLTFTMADGSQSEISTEALLEELNKLRLEMRRQASTTDDDKSVVAIGDAISSAEKGDTSRTMAHLRNAGKWAFGIAGTIGAGVAAAAIKGALGI